MVPLSRLATWQVLAIALVITLGGFGSPALQAKQKGCQEGQKGCSAPTLQKPTVSAPCCPAPVVREKPRPAEPTCCPVDPKEVHKAEKAAEHAQHEAAEACKRQQEAAAEAQRKIDEAYAHGTHEIDEATAKLNQRNSEWTEETAKLNALTAGSNESVAEVKPEPQPESEAMRSKPEPEPAPSAQPTQPIPETGVENKEVPSVAEVTPPPTPEAAPMPTPEAAPMPTPEQTKEKPKQLPKTASPLGLFGLIGFLSTSGSYVIGLFRR